MKIDNVYKVNVFNDGMGALVSDYFVRFKGEGRKTFRINAEELLSLIPGQTVFSKCKKVKIRLVGLDQGELEDGEKITFNGIHQVREEVRKQLRRRIELRSQIEEINRKIAIPEFKAYLSLEIGERRGFSLYFKERFPADIRRRYDYNIGNLFKAYQYEFEKENVPKDEVQYYRTEFRTRYRSWGWGDSYVYPIEIPYIRKEAKYRTKAAICTIGEFELVG